MTAILTAAILFVVGILIGESMAKSALKRKLGNKREYKDKKQ